MTQREIIRNNLNKSDWEITKDKCDSTRAHRRHLAANGKHENKRKIYCTNVHLRIIEILITLMYNLSAVTAAVTPGPASSENEGAGSGTGRVRAFSLVIRACWCWCGGVVSAARARGLPGGWPYLLQDVRVCLLEVVKGAEEASLDAGHVLLCEVGVVLGGGVWARPQQRHEAGCHHVWAEL